MSKYTVGVKLISDKYIVLFLSFDLRSLTAHCEDILLPSVSAADSWFCRAYVTFPQKLAVCLCLPSTCSEKKKLLRGKRMFEINY